MTEKTINEFVKEMREVFGDDQLEICVFNPDGAVRTKTSGWINEDQLIKREKARLDKNAQLQAKGASSGYYRK